jgi:DNA mismatch repair protein MutL
VESVFHLMNATLACHSAVRAGDPLSDEQVRRLLLRAGEVDFFAHCPHGRPVFKRWKKKEVSEWFHRI